MSPMDADEWFLAESAFICAIWGPMCSRLEGLTRATEWCISTMEATPRFRALRSMWRSDIC
jgi:hypothetical protein